MGRKEYSNEEITVVWKPELCIHSGICVKGLPNVFDPERRPWIKIDEAENEKIISQVKKCPSGALSMKEQANHSGENPSTIKIRLMPDGPLLVKGTCEVIDENGESSNADNLAFCRCTKSKNFPFCDGSHKD